MTFPTVRGSNLLRQQLTLPKDFQGKLNLVFIAFEQWHQMEVDSWVPLAKELLRAAHHPKQELILKMVYQ